MALLEVDRWLQRGADWLLPSRCAVCRGRGQRQGLDLCGACEADLPYLHSPCLRCGLPSDAHDVPDGPGCTRCRGIDLSFARCYAPFLYAAPLDGLVQDLKYGGALANARVLGTLLGRAVRALGLHLDVDLLVPMPLHTSRLLERGFNQSHEIARFAAREVGMRCVPRALRRQRSTSPQVGLTREARAANVAGAFGADRDQVAGRRVALVDDVVTTGSTARAAAMQLRTAGAFTVDVWSVARVPG